MSTFYYSLIKCMPDIKRQETINIGVIIFRKEGLDVQMIKSHNKLQLFATDATTDALTDIEERYTFFSQGADSPQDKHSALSLFNDQLIKLGKLSFFMAKDERDYQKNLNYLMKTLVEPLKSAKNNQKTYFVTKLKNEFEKLNLLGNSDEDITKHKVIANFMLDEAANIKAEFMLKNGAYHLTETVDFNTQQGLSEKRRQTTDKLWTYSHAQSVLESEVKKYFVYSADKINEERNQGLIDLAERGNAEIYNWESKADQIKYIDTIQKYAHMNH